MGGSLSLRPAWSIERIPGQPGLCRQALSQKKKKKKKKNQQNKTKKQKTKKTKLAAGVTSLAKVFQESSLCFLASKILYGG